MEGKERKMPAVGDLVIFHDAYGRPFNSLITAVWGPHCINIVRVSNDENRKDDCGRQIERNTSVPMIGAGHSLVYGMYARYPDETPIPVTAPVQS